MKKTIIILVCFIAVAGMYGLWLALTTDQPTPRTPKPIQTLAIPEFKLNIELNDDTGSLIYRYGSVDSRPRIFISSKELVEQSNGLCAPNETTAPIGTLTKLDSATDDFGEPLQVDGTTTFFIKNSFYLFTRPQSPCSSDDKLIELANQQRQALVAALSASSEQPPD